MQALVVLHLCDAASCGSVMIETTTLLTTKRCGTGKSVRESGGIAAAVTVVVPCL